MNDPGLNHRGIYATKPFRNIEKHDQEIESVLDCRRRDLKKLPLFALYNRPFHGCIKAWVDRILKSSPRLILQRKTR